MDAFFNWTGLFIALTAATGILLLVVLVKLFSKN